MFGQLRFKVGVAGMTAALLLASVSAHATFFDDQPTAPACNGRKVSEIGTGLAVPVDGFGHKISLGTAARMLVPAGWASNIAKNASLAPVSWKDGEPWTEAVTNTIDPGVCYVVDWNTHTFYASRNPDAMGAQVAADDPQDISPADMGATSFHAHYLYPGSLRQQIVNWANASGYDVKWSAPDFKVLSRTRLAGDFPSAVRRALNEAESAGGSRYNLNIDTASDVVSVTQIAPPAAQANWKLHPGGLKAQLEAWAAHANYQVVWRSSDDFVVATDATLVGSFPDAVQQVVDGLHAQGSPITVTIYEANRSIVISEDQS